MSKHTHTALIPGEGTDQQQRWIDAIDPQALKLHNFDVADWMKFARNFASQINYFNSENEKDGNWEDFFIDDSEIGKFLNELENESALSPHLTLFICFLKLLNTSKEHFNQITRRHLDFYYHEILKIEKQKASPDQVHVLFELAKNFSQERLEANTLLDAGKDAVGNKLTYSTQDELIANKISIAKLKNVYHHSGTNAKAIKACEVANSFDGMGKTNPSGDLKWFPFGYVFSAYTENQPELPNAKLGFAVSTDLLYLKEGQRTILIRLTFNELVPELIGKHAEQCFKIYLSGEKKWLGPFSCKTKLSGNIFDIETELDAKVEPVSGFKQLVLGERYSTELPILRVLVDLASESGYTLVSLLSQLTLSTVEVNVSVNGLNTLTIENDLGVLNSGKPFLPFGPVPVKNSKLTIKNEEIFRKNWSQINLQINWMNTPESFVNQYFAYRNDLSLPTAQLFKSGLKRKMHKPQDYETDNLIVASNSHFTASVGLNLNHQWLPVSDNQTLFTANEEGFQCSIEIGNQWSAPDENGEIQIQLNQSFLHEMFPRIYAMAMQNDSGTLIPKDPYAPMAESLTVGYKASAKALFSKLSGENNVSLFHEHPFGQALVSTDSKNTLLPDYHVGGELYIGLKDAEAQQQVSILFQVFEGSENPESNGFQTNEKIEWSVLCANSWKTLTSDYLISNKTDNLLKSGIVKFTIPAEATDDSTLLDPGLVWVRLRMDKNFDTVCKLIDIKAQAVLAQFNNQSANESTFTGQLEAGIISKLAKRRPAVKLVSQPFNSFGGIPQETDSTYYQRISERLRHKNRAITLWDYERLILQNFPEVHKVRCLNHTSGDSFLAPGNVTLVVIPDIRNKNVFDIYQPRLSRAELNDIQNYVSQLNSLHVNTLVINPEYEEVQLSLKVKFNPGYDENYYQKVLQDDLTKILSPWAFERSIDLQFGTTLHQSMIIKTIEKLKYVDFFTELKINHKGEMKTSVSPSGPKSIIVSAKSHQITVLQATCTK